MSAAAFHCSQRFAGHCLKDAVEVKGGEAGDFGKPRQRELPIQMATGIVDHPVNPFSVVISVPHASALVTLEWASRRLWNADNRTMPVIGRASEPEPGACG